MLGDESINADVCEKADFVQDLDLVVLGSSPETYKMYSAALRKEYSHMTDDSYKAMRKKVNTACSTQPLNSVSFLFSDFRNFHLCFAFYIQYYQVQGFI